MSREASEDRDIRYITGVYTNGVDKSVVRNVVYSWISDIDSPVDSSLMEIRFWALTNRTDVEKRCDLYSNPRAECILWKGALSTQGYPNFTIKGVMLGGHRVAVRLGLRNPDLPIMWAIPPRAIPKGQTIDHCVDWGCPPDTLCVNPAHLDICSRRGNTQRTRNLNVFT